MSHRLQLTLPEKILSAIPFGIGQTKPKHFRDMAEILWRNRDNLGYAWKVISKGVCDGCASAWPDFMTGRSPELISA